MIKIPSVSGFYIGIEKWFNKGYGFSSFIAEEVVGGSLSKGRIVLVAPESNEAMSLLSTETMIDIEFGKIDLGPFMTIHGLLVTKTIDEHERVVTLEFNVMPDSTFYKDSHVMIYDDPDTAISSIWERNGLKVDIRTESDLLSDTKFYQNGETDVTFLRRLLSSYKSKSIYALGLDCLLVKDLIGKNSMGKEESEDALPMFVGTSGDNLFILLNQNSYRNKYEAKLYMEPEDPAEEMENFSKYFDVRMFKDKYQLLSKQYSIAEENFMNNEKLYKSESFRTLIVSKSSRLDYEYRLGDVVQIASAISTTTFPYKYYFISKMQYQYINRSLNVNKEDIPDNESDFKVTYTLRGLDDNGTLLPKKEDDPTEKESSE